MVLAQSGVLSFFYLFFVCLLVFVALWLLLLVLCWLCVLLGWWLCWFVLVVCSTTVFYVCGFYLVVLWFVSLS